MFRRVAKAIAQAEACFPGTEPADYWEEQFYEMLASLEFLPNSPTLMNAGYLQRDEQRRVIETPDQLPVSTG